MPVTLTQQKDEMLVVCDSVRRDRFDGARKKNRLRISTSERLQQFVPAQKLHIDVRERQLMIEAQTALQSFFRKHVLRRGAKCLSESSEIFFAQRQAGRHFVAAEFLKCSRATS